MAANKILMATTWQAFPTILRHACPPESPCHRPPPPPRESSEGMGELIRNGATEERKLSEECKKQVDDESKGGDGQAHGTCEATERMSSD
eukprot:9484132-Pyramimonas_sp.AAC.1